MEKAYCQCGCGQEVGIARSNDPRYGHIKGKPFKFRSGHQHGKRPETLEGILSICKADENGCLNWTKSLDRKGYGQYAKNGVRTGVHRVVYEMVHGEIGSRSLVVLHSCDNPKCCNPKHLRLGTHLDNNRDAKAKGRSAVGSKHGMAKLGDEDVLKILSSDKSPKFLSLEYGVSIGQIHSIQCRKSWPHVPDTRSDRVKARVEQSSERKKKHLYEGRLMHGSEVAKAVGIPVYSLRYWLKKGMSIEAAVIEALRRKK